MIVRIDRSLQRTSRERRDHLVDIHVAAGARARLKHVDRKFRVVPTSCHSQGGVTNGVGKFRNEITQLPIRRGRRIFDQPQRANERARHPQTARRKILQGALGLCTP